MCATTAQGGVVGRDAEIARVTEFVASVPAGPAALVLEGEAGIGKTTVWSEGLSAGRARSLNVLTCRPGPAESRLSFAGLTDLLSGVAERTVGHLPEPQRIALEVALLRADPMPGGPDRRAVAMGCLSVLRDLSPGAGVLVAIDDEQWLDSPTRAALAFAFRRLGDLPVGILVARRPDPQGAAPFDLGRALPANRFQRIILEPLEEPALRSLISQQSHESLPPRTISEVTRWSGGNPFLALEILREQRRLEARPGAAAPVPVPRPLLDVVTRRITALPSQTRRALLATATLASPTVDGVVTAVGQSARAALRRAEAEGVIAMRDGSIAFAHPLLAAASYDSASSQARGKMHRRLAATVPNVEEAVWHLALASDQADEPTARALEEAAAYALARGAPDGAAELLQLACERTPSSVPDMLHRRQLLAADCLLRAGDIGGAHRRYEALTDESMPRRIRAFALAALGRIAFYTQGIREGVALLRRSLELMDDDPRSATLLHSMLVLADVNENTQWRQHLAAAFSAFDRVASPDPPLRSLMAEMREFREFFDGGAMRVDRVEAALVAERAARTPVTAERAQHALAIALGRTGATTEDVAAPLELPITADASAEGSLGDVLQMAEQHDRARAQWQSVHRIALESGDDLSAAHALGHLSDVEARVGNWLEADRCARESLVAAKAFGQMYHVGFSLARLALLDALRGRQASARENAATMLADPRWRQNAWATVLCYWGLGLLELSLGNLREAEEQLGHIATIEERMMGKGLIGPPTFLCYWADRVEALSGLGRLDLAEDVTNQFEDAARRGPADWARALAHRCRAILGAARGNVEVAVQEIDAAEQLLRPDRDSPFELARTLLVSGEIRRRARRKREAHDRLEEAVAIFQRLGAATWVARGRTELDRVGLRPHAPTELTEIEREVARLAARGLTNREVAAAVFVTPKTVEGVLSRVYGKLGIRTRAELGAMHAREELGAGDARFDRPPG